MRYIRLIAYYGFARFLPSGLMSGVAGSFSRKVRYIICRGLFLKCGVNVNIERRAHFNSGSRIVIGAHSGLGINCIINGGATIGSYVMMGPDVIIYRGGHKVDRTDVPMYQQGTIERVPLTIEDDVWIGARVIILPGCKRIAKGAIIGAGAVVTKDVPEYSVFCGNPARVLRYRGRNSKELSRTL
jgi:maltose O-acetyltransferase